MKTLFAALLCFVLAASQTFAIKGGPNYGGAGNLVGQYAGVLHGPTNALGIFTLGVPNTGTSKGSFIIFTRGLFLNGNVQAVADGTKARIDGLVHAEATRATQSGNSVQTTIVAVADGQIMATVTKSNNTFGASATLLTGTAVVNEHGPDDVSSNPANDQSFIVTGFKQSNSPPQ